jgi:hypothetical protein
MNPFKSIAIFRDQLCNCLPWGKDTVDIYRKEKEWEFWPNKDTAHLDYKYLLEENERLERLVQSLVLQLSKRKSPLLDRVESLLTEKDIQQMALFDDGGVDGIPRNK